MIIWKLMWIFFQKCRPFHSGECVGDAGVFKRSVSNFHNNLDDTYNKQWQRFLRRHHGNHRQYRAWLHGGADVRPV